MTNFRVFCITNLVNFMKFTISKLTVVITLLLGSCLSLRSTEYKLSAYVDAYTAIDNAHLLSTGGQPIDDYAGYRTFSIVNGLKNQLGLNVAQLSATVTDSLYRAVFTIHAGDMITQSWDATYPNIQEAYVGYHFFDKLWVDAGFFSTFIGGELFLPKDNFLSSNAMVTYFEPLYHSGIRATLSVTDEFSVGLHIMNSMSKFSENNENKSFGLYLNYTSNDFFASYAGEFGNEVPGQPSLAKLSTIHSIVAGTNAIKDLQLKGQFDMFTLEDGKIGNDGKATSASLMALAVQGKYSFTEKFAAALRFGWFNNEDALGDAPAVTGMDITAGVEYKPSKDAYIRLEGRMLNFDENGGKVFFDGTELTNSRMEAALNFGVSFDLVNINR